MAQHAAEAHVLWVLRSAAVKSVTFKLPELVGLDGRLEAHLDGLRIAGDSGWSACEQSFADSGPGVLFPATVLALEARHDERLEFVLALSQSTPELRGGVLSGFGWVAASVLRGTVRRLLRSQSSAIRAAALACCAMHRVDPGILPIAVANADGVLRSRALRAAGELGSREMLQTCQDAYTTMVRTMPSYGRHGRRFCLAIAIARSKH